MDPPPRRSRLIVRLGAFLVSHSLAFTCFCSAAGTAALLLLPLLAKTTYISENALMPGSANPTFSLTDAHQAEALIRDLLSANASAAPSLLAAGMAAAGADVYLHTFLPHTTLFRPLRFFSSSSSAPAAAAAGAGVNAVGVIRAPRGDGKESIVLVTPYDPRALGRADAASLGLGLAVFSLLSRAAWLAKDIVWVVSDSRFGDHTAVAAWLGEYHDPAFLVELPARDESNVFKRAGTMAAGIVLKVVDREETSDSVTIYSEASNGQMPNLDLINVVQYLAVHRQAFRVKIGSFDALRGSALLRFIGGLLELLSNVAGSVNAGWRFGIPVSDYVDGTATLASSICKQALGVPTGPHGAFRDYQVDAITLEISPRIPLYRDIGQSGILVRGGRLIEGVVRSVNNLLEKFHQSFFLYLLTSSNKFVSVGVYMISFALLVAPLPIVAAALFSDYSRAEKSEPAAKDGRPADATEAWQWIHSAKVALAVHLWALLVSLIPCFILELSVITPRDSVLLWVGLGFGILPISCLMLGSPYSSSRPMEWCLLKAVMIAAASIGLCLMSIINFATAQIGAFFLVPMCLMAKPLKRSRLYLSAINGLMGIVGFPAATVLILEGMSWGYDKVGIADLWQWASLLWVWNSATYLYVFLIHLPCWFLFMLVLLHP